VLSGDVIRVVPEDLRASAAKVQSHADELQVRHVSAHGRIEAALGGVPAAAAAALSTAVAKWHSDSTVTFGNLVQHGGAMGSSDVDYSATEGSSSAAIEAVGANGSATSAGL
jgi:hypothetical protein